MHGNTARQKSIFSKVLTFKNKYRRIAKLVFLVSESANSNYDMPDWLPRGVSSYIWNPHVLVNLTTVEGRSLIRKKPVLTHISILF